MKENEFYIIENPISSKMKEYINDLIPYYDKSYCMYGVDYKKPTRFWTNITEVKIKTCNHKKHKQSIGDRTDGNVGNKLDKYRIPEKLCNEFITHTI